MTYQPSGACFFIAHCQCLVDSFGCPTSIPGINRNTRSESAVTIRTSELQDDSVHGARCYIKSAHLAKDKRSMATFLAFDELVCSERHTLSQACDHERICDGQKGQVLTKGQVLRMQKDDWLVGQSRVFGVDMRGDIRNSSRNFVGFCGLKCYLYKHGLKSYILIVRPWL